MKTFETKQFEEKIFSYMEHYHMLSPGDKVIAGISGGADSVCLLFVLLAWRKKYGLDLFVVHVNHGIRTQAAADAMFVEALCKQNEIPFLLRETDIHALAKERKCSEEEAGRFYRYQVFEEALDLYGATKIAVAHNANDRSETMLFHLFRGSALKGLAGILPVRENIIRPLLCVERGEIEEYLAAKNQDFCHDATNDEDAYTRNRIRHHILPYAQEQVVSGCVSHMGRTAELLLQTEDYLEQQTKKELENCILSKTEREVKVDVQTILSLHPAMQNRVLYELIRGLSTTAKDISGVHVEDLKSLFLLEGNRQVHLPYGIIGQRVYQYVSLKMTGIEVEQEVSLEKFVQFQVLSAEELPKDAENSVIFPQNQYTKWFDYDKMNEYPIVRTRMSGDYLTICDADGKEHHKKLKVYMVEEKIPKDKRGSIPVLAQGSHIVWVVGYRISEYYKIDGNTKRVLQVKWLKEDHTEDEDGRTC